MTNLQTPKEYKEYSYNNLYSKPTGTTTLHNIKKTPYQIIFQIKNYDYSLK
jgi:hypothetical protein